MSLAQGKKMVLCVGCIVIDFITVTKEYPEEDTDRRCLQGYWQRGGNASNNCTVLRNLGLKVEFFGMISRSEAFRMLLEDMKKRDIKYDHCSRTDQDPPFSSVIVALETGSRTIINCNNNYPYVTAEDFERIDLEKFGWVHFEGRKTKETLLMMRAVLDYNNGREQKITMSLDLERELDDNIVLCDMVDYVVFSKDEAVLQGWMNPEDACRNLDDKLQIRTGISVRRPNIICPWGVLGVGCLDNNGNYVFVEAKKQKKVIDTLGAGDTFMAAFIYAKYVLDKSLADAVKFANYTASFKCAHRGYDRVAEVLLEANKI